MKTIEVLLTALALLTAAHADDLSPQEIEKSRSRAEQVFEGTIEKVENSPDDNPQKLGDMKFAKVRITAVTKGVLKVGVVENVYYYHVEGRKPNSPNLVSGKKYKFFLQKTKIGNSERLFLSDVWLAEESKAGEKFEK